MVAQRIAEPLEPLEIHIDPESEAGRRLAEAGGRPVVLVSGGHRFSVVTGSSSAEHDTRSESANLEDPFANYDPEKALAAWRGTFGILKGLDAEAFKAEMREARGQDRRGTT